MTPRPKHPPPDRRREILDAALQVFAHKGFATAFMVGPLLATVLTRDFLQIPAMKEVTNEELLRQLTETLIPALLTQMPQKE